MKLKNCPFCGSKAQLAFKEDGKWGRLWYVKCSKCYARISGFYEPSDLSEKINPYKSITEIVEEAINAWNERQQEMPMEPIFSEEKYGDTLGHCPSCEKALPNIGIYGRSYYCYKCGRAIKWE